jgi:hypothetical protein
MSYYPLAGLAHKLIFLGFSVLLLRSLILWGRGFDPAFNFGIFGETPANLPLLGAVPLGLIYEFLKDVFASLVLLGTAVFLYYRLIKPQKRMSLHPEGLLILGIISCMMVADMLYDGASLVLRSNFRSFGCDNPASDMIEACVQGRAVLAHFPQPVTGGEVGFAFWPSPAGSLFAVMLNGSGLKELVFLAHAGFWTHSALVLIFLNLLPHSKHFNIITSLPNAFTADITPAIRIRPMAETGEKLMEAVGAAAERPTPSRPGWRRAHRAFHVEGDFGLLHVHRMRPVFRSLSAHRTGRSTGPKQLTLDLRDHLYGREVEFLYRPGGPGSQDGSAGAGDHGAGQAQWSRPTATPTDMALPRTRLGAGHASGTVTHGHGPHSPGTTTATGTTTAMITTVTATTNRSIPKIPTRSPRSPRRPSTSCRTSFTPTSSGPAPRAAPAKSSVR